MQGVYHQHVAHVLQDYIFSQLSDEIKLQKQIVTKIPPSISLLKKLQKYKTEC